MGNANSLYQLNLINENNDLPVSSQGTAAAKIDIHLTTDEILDIKDEQLIIAHRVTIKASHFQDGRVFSLGREFRLRGFNGCLIALGDFLPDQLKYLRLCGFDLHGLNTENLHLL